MARWLKVTVVHGDGSDPTILEEAGAHGADAVLAVTPNDQDNLAICQLASMQYSVPRTVALVNDPGQRDGLPRAGRGGLLDRTDHRQHDRAAHGDG